MNNTSEKNLAAFLLNTLYIQEAVQSVKFKRKSSEQPARFTPDVASPLLRLIYRFKASNDAFRTWFTVGHFTEIHPHAN